MSFFASLQYNQLKGQTAKLFSATLLFCWSFLVFFDASSLGAETVFMRDGSSFECNVVHLYDNSVQVVLTSGDSLTISRNEIQKIIFIADSTEKTAVQNAPKPKKIDPAFATPNRTVENWQRALKHGDFEAMANCFISSAQGLMLKKLKDLPENERKKMIRDAKKTDFKISEARIDGDRAILNVTSSLSDNNQVEEVTLLLENGLWKMIPNQ